MGVDLIVAATAWHQNARLDFEKGRQLVNNGDPWEVFGHEEIDEAFDNLCMERGLEDDDNTEDKVYNLAIRDLRDVHLISIDHVEQAVKGTSNFRDYTHIPFGDWWLLIAGGQSAGDSPGPTFDALVRLQPPVIDAIGLYWPGRQ